MAPGRILVIDDEPSVTDALGLVLTELCYEWPGNVRELESVIEHAVLFATEDKLTPEALPEELHVAPDGEFRCVIPPYFTMEEIEREAIAQTLERTVETSNGAPKFSNTIGRGCIER